MRLRLFLPERADEKVTIDKPIEFWALAMNDAQAEQFKEEKIYTASGIEKSRAGRIKLVIMPRGVGKIEVSAVDLFAEIQKGESVETNFTIRNSGTRRLDNIKITTEQSLNWQVEVTPDIIDSLEVNREVNPIRWILWTWNYGEIR